ncbi:MAG: hypothetical protein K0U93_02905 [Gammaproteobacteria bacterium]|nr:hypothetical protein [Gammaproteobacteria bacterium]
MRNVILAICCVVCVGCTSAVERQRRVQMDLDRPINCERADADIAMLNKEKVGTLEQIANGAGTILPTSAVFNLLTGEFEGRYAIASGEYNEMLDAKIKQIAAQCSSG